MVKIYLSFNQNVDPKLVKKLIDTFNNNKEKIKLLAVEHWQGKAVPDFFLDPNAGIEL